MQLAKEAFKNVKGRVWGYLFNPTTGEKRDYFEKDNVVTFTGADILAQLLGGNTNFVPAHMGFLYGLNNTATYVDPEDIVDLADKRRHSFEDITSEVVAETGANPSNILVVPLSSAPIFEINGSDDGRYTGNAVTLTGVTNAAGELIFNGANFDGALADGDFFYHVFLLNRRVVNGVPVYTTFSRVALGTAPNFPQKVAGFELALFWQITFF